MKKYIIAISLFLLAFTSQSQILISLLLGDKLNSDKLEFGLEGGFNYSRISGFESKKYHIDWNLGFYFDFKIHEPWHFYTGVLVKSKLGSNKLTNNDLNTLGASIHYKHDGTLQEGKYSQQMDYFLVPLLAKYMIKKQFYVELGPQLGLMYRSWIQFESDIDGFDAIVKEYNRKKLNKLDVGLMLGVGYTLFKGTGWTFGAKYYYGFVNVYKGMPGTKNSSFFIKVNIPIGAGEEAKKKAAAKAEKKKAKKEAKQMNKK